MNPDKWHISYVFGLYIHNDTVSALHRYRGRQGTSHLVSRCSCQLGRIPLVPASSSSGHVGWLVHGRCIRWHQSVPSVWVSRTNVPAGLQCRYVLWLHGFTITFQLPAGSGIDRTLALCVPFACICLRLALIRRDFLHPRAVPIVNALSGQSRVKSCMAPIILVRASPFSAQQGNRP